MVEHFAGKKNKKYINWNLVVTELSKAPHCKGVKQPVNMVPQGW